jgi:hypothetical protein
MSEITDRLVHPDQSDLLADDGHLEHLIGQDDLVIVPTRCRRSGFAVFQAFERDNDAIPACEALKAITHHL